MFHEFNLKGAGTVSKKILMIAGPNGTGKTTMTLELITDQTMLKAYSQKKCE